MYFLIPFSKQENKIKNQVTQNKHIGFSLRLNSRDHIGAKEFKEVS